MTTSPGYPDWQAGAQWRSDPIIAQTAFALGTVNSVVGTIELGNFAYLAFYAIPTGNNAAVTVEFYDQSQSFLQGSFVFAMLAGTNAAHLVPASGAIAVVSASRNAGAAATLRMDVYGTNVPRDTSPLNDVLIHGNTGNVAAAGLFTQAFSGYHGPITIAVDASATAFTTRLHTLALDGTTTVAKYFVSAQATSTSLAQEWYLAPELNRFSIGNNSAGIQNYDYAIVAELFSGHA